MFMVLNNAFQPMSPSVSGFYKAKELPSDTAKLYVDKRDLAEEFAEWLAHKNLNNRFYLVEVLDYVQTEEPPVVWKTKTKKDV